MKTGRGRWIALVAVAAAIAVPALSGCRSDAELYRDDPKAWWRAEIRRDFGTEIYRGAGGRSFFGSLSRNEVEVLGSIAAAGTDTEKWAVATLLGDMAREDGARNAAVAVLAPMLQSDDKDVRKRALGAIAQMGVAGEPFLVQALESPREEIRFLAAWDLCMFFPPQPPTVRSRIIDNVLAQGSDDVITRYVLESLGPWALPELERTRVGSEGARREALDQAIRGIRGDAHTGPR